MKLSKLKIVSLLLGVSVIIGATAFEKGLGTFCALCPVGFLQIVAATRNIPVGMIFGVACGVLLTLIIGRFFCAWLCPSTLVKTVANSHKKQSYKRSPYFLKITPYLVLFIALMVSFIVGFPVFCLLCPVGLFFGFIFAIFKLFHIYEPSWNLIIFPAILALELILFKRWCAYICPMVGIFALLRKIPVPKFALKVNNPSCRSFQGKKCNICSESCPEGLEITKSDEIFEQRCTVCMECKDQCPTKSILIVQTKK